MQITGRAFIKNNGQLLRSKNGAKLMYGNNERTPVMGDSGVHGFTEQISAPGIECTISHGPDINLTELAAITDAGITFETDTGRTFLLRNAWLANAMELTANEDGELPLVFNGMSCEEL